MLIAVDLYDCLADYLPHAGHVCGFDHRKVRGPDPRDHLTETERERLATETSRPGFFSTLPPIEHAAIALDDMRRNYGGDVVLFSAPRLYCLGWYDIQSDWNRRHFPGLFADFLPTDRPDLIRADVVISPSRKTLARCPNARPLLYANQTNTQDKAHVRVGWSAIGPVFQGP